MSLCVCATPPPTTGGIVDLSSTNGEVHPALPPKQAVKKKRARTTQDAGKKKKSKRRQHAGAQAPVFAGPSEGSNNDVSVLCKLIEAQEKKLSHVVKALQAVRQEVEQHANEITQVLGELRTSISLEIGSVSSKLDNHKVLVNRLLARERTQAEVMRSILDKIDP